VEQYIHVLRERLKQQVSSSIRVNQIVGHRISMPEVSHWRLSGAVVGFAACVLYLLPSTNTEFGKYGEF
jgi:hypothetical protein